MPVIKVQDVSKAFGATVALRGVNFEVSAGEVHALVGENGSGKSTLMRIMHGEESADSGQMTLENSPYSPSNPRDALSQGVSLIHQELAVCPHLTVSENIFLGAERHRFGNLDRKAMIHRSRELLGQLGHGDLSPERLVRDLNPAMRQVVEIARALRSDAKVLLFDEPTSSLGRHDVALLFAVIRDLKSQGKAIVYISHFLDEITEIADRATVLRDGEVVGMLDKEDFSLSALAAMMVGREILEADYRREKEIGDVVFSTKELSGTHMPIKIDLKIHQGEVFGFAGLNGAGRTETLRCLFGLDAVRTGEVNSRGEAIRPDARMSWRRKFGMVSEDRKGEGVALQLSISENLTLPAMGTRVVNRDLHTQRTQSIIDRLNVKCAGPSQKIRQLSGGNQQKVAIGRLLDAESDILLLDEPTRGIDIGSKAEIYHLISELAAAGKTILIASSYLPELTDLCDRIAILRRGELVSIVDPRVVAPNEIMEWCAGA